MSSKTQMNSTTPWSRSSCIELVSTSLSHMSDLKGDDGRVDAQIAEADMYATRNYGIGKLVGDLEAQKAFGQFSARCFNLETRV